jgi:hypothetical protein
MMFLSNRWKVVLVLAIIVLALVAVSGIGGACEPAAPNPC